MGFLRIAVNTGKKEFHNLIGLKSNKALPEQCLIL